MGSLRSPTTKNTSQWARFARPPPLNAHYKGSLRSPTTKNTSQWARFARPNTRKIKGGGYGGTLVPPPP